MKTLKELREEKEKATSDLLTACGVFFAFSLEQFEKNKTPLEKDDKYTEIYGGGYMPKSKRATYTQGIGDIMKKFDEDIQANDLRAKYILYELNNHESFYTGELEDTHASLIGSYTIEEVAQVYRDYRAKKYARATTSDDY